MQIEPLLKFQYFVTCIQLSESVKKFPVNCTTEQDRANAMRQIFYDFGTIWAGPQDPSPWYRYWQANLTKFRLNRIQDERYFVESSYGGEGEWKWLGSSNPYDVYEWHVRFKKEYEEMHFPRQLFGGKLATVEHFDGTNYTIRLLESEWNKIPQELNQLNQPSDARSEELQKQWKLKFDAKPIFTEVHQHPVLSSMMAFLRFVVHFE